MIRRVVPLLLAAVLVMAGGIIVMRAELGPIDSPRCPEDYSASVSVDGRFTHRESGRQGDILRGTCGHNWFRFDDEGPYKLAAPVVELRRERLR
jgi:hypothetical protein